MNGKKIAAIAFGVFALLAALIMVPMMWMNVDAKEIVVLQAVGGDLEVITSPGLKWRGFGKVTRYSRRDQFSFSQNKDQGKTIDESIQTRFNDGGHANISGTLNWAMPLAVPQVLRLHKEFGSTQAIEQQLIRPVVQKVIYNVGPTMSSTESSAEKRPNIPQYIDDQLQNGPYLTKTVQMTVKDPITGQDKQMNVVQFVMDEHGVPSRESKSQITDYGIALQAVAIDNIKYDPVVEKQITERQNATTQVQIAIANARKAEQDAITIAKQGEASAAKAKWEQEVVNAKEIAEADKRVRVAQADVQAAQLFKQSETLKGEGEAARKKLVMEADGQMDKKLAAIVEINHMYADAIKSAQPGAWSPQVVMGGAGQTNGGQNATQLIDLMTAKTAKELGLDLGIRSGAAVPAKK